MLHHITDLFDQERHRPLEQVHTLGQMEGVLYILVLFNVHFVVLNQDDSTLVVILTAVVRC